MFLKVPYLIACWLPNVPGELSPEWSRVETQSDYVKHTYIPPSSLLVRRVCGGEASCGSGPFREGFT